MSTMQLRDQDFKKITSQIQSQTIQNAQQKAQKKKLQLTNVDKSGRALQAAEKDGTTVGVS